jgi:hypothetical protein
MLRLFIFWKRHGLIEEDTTQVCGIAQSIFHFAEEEPPCRGEGVGHEDAEVIFPKAQCIDDIRTMPADPSIRLFEAKNLIDGDIISKMGAIFAWHITVRRACGKAARMSSRSGVAMTASPNQLGIRMIIFFGGVDGHGFFCFISQVY